MHLDICHEGVSTILESNDISIYIDTLYTNHPFREKIDLDTFLKMTIISISVCFVISTIQSKNIRVLNKTKVSNSQQDLEYSSTVSFLTVLSWDLMWLLVFLCQAPPGTSMPSLPLKPFSSLPINRVNKDTGLQISY